MISCQDNRVATTRNKRLLRVLASKITHGACRARHESRTQTPSTPRDSRPSQDNAGMLGYIERALDKHLRAFQCDRIESRQSRFCVCRQITRENRVAPVAKAARKHQAYRLIANLLRVTLVCLGTACKYRLGIYERFTVLTLNRVDVER